MRGFHRFMFCVYSLAAVLALSAYRAEMVQLRKDRHSQLVLPNFTHTERSPMKGEENLLGYVDSDG